MVRAHSVYAIGIGVAFAFGIALFLLISDHRREIRVKDGLIDHCMTSLGRAGRVIQSCTSELAQGEEPEIGL